MTDQSHSAPATEEAFRMLAEIARKQLEAGKSSRSAGMKPALQARTNPPFDEKVLGFASFREFVRAAAAASFVDLLEVEAVGDVDVLPRGLGSSIGAAGRTSDKIRPDLWRAFTRWGNNEHRLWDRRTGEAVGLGGATETGSEDAATAALLAALENDPARFVAIDPVTPDQLLGWMTEFANEQHDAVMRAALHAALNEDLPIRKFTATVREIGLGRPWHLHNLSRVATLIQNWAAENSVRIDSLFEPSAAREPRRAEQRPSPTPPAVQDTETLRRQVIRYIEQMTEPELLQIPIPVRLLALGGS